MPFITAERIHDGRGFLPAGTVIEIDNEGLVVALHKGGTGNAIFYDGILSPGFVNVHCHLELSHMKGVIPVHTGLIPFLQSVTFRRNDFTEEQKITARLQAYRELVDNGVVAVGDIANTTDTFDLRATGALHFHTFVEAIGFSEANAQRSFERSLAVYEAFAGQEVKDNLLRQSIVPHAPYSVASSLFKFISSHQADAVISIHNQESRAEDEYYLLKQGAVKDLLGGFGIDDSHFTPSGRSSLQTYLNWLSQEHPVIFIHNTYTSLNDVQVANSYLKKAYWCFCPNANLYIENTLPDVAMFVQEGCNICIGTDSLSSNHQLSVLAELQTLKQHFPALSWETLLQWGTCNGATALNMQQVIGSIETGKKPGILQLVTDAAGNPVSANRLY